MKEHNRQSIMKVTSYVDDGGREVREFEQCFGKDKEPNSYVGVALVVMQAIHPVTGAPVRKHEALEFPIDDVTSIKKAFEKFDDAAQVDINKRQEAAKKQAADQSRIITPGGKPALSLLGADGKPAGG